MESTGEEVVYKRILKKSESLIVELTSDGRPIVKIVSKKLTGRDDSGIINR